MDQRLSKIEHELREVRTTQKEGGVLVKSQRDHIADLRKALELRHLRDRYVKPRT